MVEKPSFQTIKSFAVDFGTRNFIELALKQTSEGGQFISISKGFTDQAGNKRYKRSLGFAVNDKVISFLVDKLGELKGLEGEKADKKAPKK